MTVYPDMFDSAEVKRNLKNLLQESPEKGQSYYQSLLYTWAVVDDTCSFSWLVPLSK